MFCYRKVVTHHGHTVVLLLMQGIARKIARAWVVEPQRLAAGCRG
jgi:hypothetical protein